MQIVIACDESGYEGEKLVGGETDVFAHASVRMTTESAARCIVELRRRIRSPALEYKANHLLREKHRPVLEWLLGPAGPIHGDAHVHLVDKSFLVVTKIVDLLVAATPDHRADAMALTLYREGRRTIAREDWSAFLASSNTLLRTRNRQGVRARIDSFSRTVEVLRAGASSEAEHILGLLQPCAHPPGTSLLDDPGTIPALDLLVPAIVHAVLHWSDECGGPVSIVHDRQTALTEERIAQITETFGESGRLTDVTLVASRSDPRVQVADFLAGVARKAASDELADRGDAELGALLRPYVDPSSIWATTGAGPLGSGRPAPMIL